MKAMSCHALIRQHLLEHKGVPDHSTAVNYDRALQAVQTSMHNFFEFMRNRILMGRYRYGDWKADKYVDYCSDMARCLKSYMHTRNTEFLVDLANYAWIEFRYGSHPGKHFKAVDDGEHSKQ